MGGLLQLVFASYIKVLSCQREKEKLRLPKLSRLPIFGTPIFMESIKQLDFDHAALARTYLSEGRLEEAEKLYLTALAVAEQVHGAQSQEAIPPLTNQANFHFERADFAKARVYLERLFNLLSAQDWLAYARTGGQLASCLEWCAENDQAEKVLLATIRSAEKGLGCEHEVTQTLLLELGNHYVRVGVYVAARAVFEELVELFTSLCPESVALIDVYARLADVYDKMSLYEDRIAILEKQLALQEKSEQGAISLASTLYLSGTPMVQPPVISATAPWLRRLCKALNVPFQFMKIKATCRLRRF